MAVWTCAECRAAYSVGATRCPQCGSTVRMEDTDTPEPQPITVACTGNGCAVAGVRVQVWPRLAAPGVVERPPLHCAGCGAEMTEISESEETDMPKVTVHTGPSIDEPEPEPEGGDESSPGSSSETSSEQPSTGPETSDPETPSPARTTGSRSRKGRTASSTAGTTDGGPTAATSETADTDSDK